MKLETLETEDLHYAIQLRQFTVDKDDFLSKENLSIPDFLVNSKYEEKLKQYTIFSGKTAVLVKAIIVKPYFQLADKFSYKRNLYYLNYNSVSKFITSYNLDFDIHYYNGSVVPYHKIPKDSLFIDVIMKKSYVYQKQAPTDQSVAWEYQLVEYPYSFEDGIATLIGNDSCFYFSYGFLWPPHYGEEHEFLVKSVSYNQYKGFGISHYSPHSPSDMYLKVHREGTLLIDSLDIAKGYLRYRFVNETGVFLDDGNATIVRELEQRE